MALLVSDECFSSQKKGLFGNVEQGEPGVPQRGFEFFDAFKSYRYFRVNHRVEGPLKPPAAWLE
jgi:hypothetical protein